MDQDDIFAFLFDSSDPICEYTYGDKCLRELFRATLLAKPEGGIVSAIYSGDIILSTLSQVVSAFDGTHKNHSTAMSVDKNRYADMLWETIDSIALDWHTVDLDNLPYLLPHNRTYSLTFATSEHAAKIIDSQLKKFSPYLGAVKITNDPLLRLLMMRQLVCHSAIQGANVTSVEDSWMGNVFDDGCANSKHYSFDWVAYGSLNAPKPPKAIVTDRAKQLIQKIEDESWKSHRVKVAELLASDTIKVKFSTDLPEGFQNIEIPRSKLVDYALNLDHPSGKHKALLFKTQLEILAADWEYLFHQIVEGLEKSVIQKTQVTEYGIQYGAYVPVVGKNGKTKTVVTGWVTRENTATRLTSIYLASAEEQILFEDQEILLIPSKSSDEERWEEIYLLANKKGKIAFDKCVPSPMVVHYLDKKEMVREGICGSGTVCFNDGRSKLAKWVLKTNKGARNYPRGVYFRMNTDSQSYEKNVAYADAFAHVFKINGINCTVEKRID